MFIPAPDHGPVREGSPQGSHLSNATCIGRKLKDRLNCKPFSQNEVCHLRIPSCPGPVAEQGLGDTH